MSKVSKQETNRLLRKWQEEGCKESGSLMFIKRLEHTLGTTR